MAQWGEHRSAMGVVDDFHSVTIKPCPNYLPVANLRAPDRTSLGMSKRKPLNTPYHSTALRVETSGQHRAT